VCDCIHLCLFHTADTDKTRQFSVVLHTFETEQLLIGNWVGLDNTKLSRLVVNSVHAADTDKTRQDKTVLSCLCRQCEIGITLSKYVMLTHILFPLFACSTKTVEL